MDLMSIVLIWNARLRKAHQDLHYNHDGMCYTCETCKGTGLIRKVSNILGQDEAVIESCPDCHGSGKLISNTVSTLQEANI